jgi:protein-S-isoprenylcysteine O-methyltransferase Ste14
MMSSVRLPDLGTRGQGWVWLQAIMMAAIPVVAGLGARWPASWRWVMVVIGAACVGLGCALLVAGILGLGRSFAAYPGPNSQGLVTSGIYARTRHPIFGGWILIGLGFAAAFSPWALPLAALLAAELTAKSVVEERMLRAQYPDYATYRERVPHRFFPWPSG